jgi:S-adenosylmethionine synthetase
MGEISSSCTPDYEAVARSVIRDMGYTVPGEGFDAASCRVDVDIHRQSPDIDRGVSRAWRRTPEPGIRA